MGEILRTIAYNLLMEWIAVNERLPQENVPVLIAASLAAGIKKTVALAYWSLELNDWDIERDDRLIGINSDTIHHWMPIPVLPESNV